MTVLLLWITQYMQQKKTRKIKQINILQFDISERNSEDCLERRERVIPPPANILQEPCNNVMQGSKPAHLATTVRVGQRYIPHIAFTPRNVRLQKHVEVEYLPVDLDGESFDEFDDHNPRAGMCVIL